MAAKRSWHRRRVIDRLAATPRLPRALVLVLSIAAPALALTAAVRSCSERPAPGPPSIATDGRTVTLAWDGASGSARAIYVQQFGDSAKGSRELSALASPITVFPDRGLFVSWIALGGMAILDGKQYATQMIPIDCR
jgi:hypothetical protein